MIVVVAVLVGPILAMRIRISIRSNSGIGSDIGSGSRRSRSSSIISYFSRRSINDSDSDSS